MICPLLCIIFFRYQKISGKQKGSFTKLFVSVLWDKKFRQNRDAPAPPMHGSFRWKNFSETPKRFPMKYLGSDTKILTENCDTPPPPYADFFDTRNYCYSEGFPYGFFRHCEKRNVRRKNLILPLLLSKLFLHEIIETLKGSPTKFFGTVRQKFFGGKSWYSPLSHPNFFDTQNIWNTKGFRSYRNFRHCEKKNFRQKILKPPPSYP